MHIPLLCRPALLKQLPAHHFIELLERRVIYRIITTLLSPEHRQIFAPAKAVAAPLCLSAGRIVSTCRAAYPWRIRKSSVL
jgi:hypothetical protein